MMTALTIIHVVISLALVVVVLMQHGKQQGLSGAIAGGAETFFGKNKGRTVDAMLKKFTAVVALLFIASSIVFTTVAVNEHKKAQNAVAPQAETTQIPVDANAVSPNENADGTVVMPEQTQTEQTAPAEGAVPAENAPAASAAPATSEAPKN